MKKSAQFKLILVVTGMVNCSGADILWPADTEWNALMQGAGFYFDTSGDTRPESIDLVGTSDTYSAGYWALVDDGYVSGGVTDDAFMFRLRVGGSGGKFSWQVSLDTNEDASNVEWILQLV